MHCLRLPTARRCSKIFWRRWPSRSSSGACGESSRLWGYRPICRAGCCTITFHLVPPLHSAYNPPYLPELAERLLQPIQQAHLFHLPLADFAPAPNGVDSQPAHITPLDPTRLAGDLLPLLRDATVNGLAFVPPDEAEAHFLLAWLGAWPLHGWLASTKRKMARESRWVLCCCRGILPRPCDAHGAGASQLRAPGWPGAHNDRRRAVGCSTWPCGASSAGRGLARSCCSTRWWSAQARGWQHLEIGPLPEGKLHAAARALAIKFGGEPRQHYVTYEAYV